jgi:hypothetical protein
VAGGEHPPITSRVITFPIVIVPPVVGIPCLAAYPKPLAANLLPAQLRLNRDPATADLNQAATTKVLEDAVDRDPRGPRETGDIVLRERHGGGLAGVSEPVHKLRQGEGHPFGGRCVERIDELVREPGDSLGEQGDQEAVDLAVLSAEAIEVDPQQCVGLAGLERVHGRAPGCPRTKQGELTEAFAGSNQGECARVAKARGDPNGEASGRDQVEGVGGIVSVEDHFASTKPPPPGD